MKTISKAEVEKRKQRPAPQKKPASDTGKDLVKSIAAEAKAMSEVAKSMEQTSQSNAKMVKEAITALGVAVQKPQKREPVRLKVKRYDNDPDKSIEYVDVVPLRKK
jgi:hypothetical protein